MRTGEAVEPSEAPQRPEEEGEVHQSLFEGLFVRALRVEGPIVEELAAAGYDPRAPSAKYPREVWRRCLRIACRHFYPQRSEEAAAFELGTRFVDGFFATLHGKVIATTISFLTLDLVVKRLPRLTAMLTDRVKVDSEPVRPGVWRVKFAYRHGSAEFSVGALDGVLRRTKLGTATLVSQSLSGFVVEVSAPARS